MPLRARDEVPITLQPQDSTTFSEALSTFEAAVTFKELLVMRFRQQQTQWCWAASAQMVMHFYGDNSITQCDLANWLFDQSSCCVTASSSDCNQGCEIRDIKQVYKEWGIQSTRKSTSVSFAKLREEINAGRPVEIVFEWEGGGGHAAIIRGYRQDEDGNYLLVNDPLDEFNQVEVQYEFLKDAYGLGSWNRTWVDLKK
jgi:hypothetical protein